VMCWSAVIVSPHGAGVFPLVTIPGGRCRGRGWFRGCPSTTFGGAPPCPVGGSRASGGPVGRPVPGRPCPVILGPVPAGCGAAQSCVGRFGGRPPVRRVQRPVFRRL